MEDVGITGCEIMMDFDAVAIYLGFVPVVTSDLARGGIVRELFRFVLSVDVQKASFRNPLHLKQLGDAHTPVCVLFRLQLGKVDHGVVHAVFNKVLLK